ncbi:MAG TPA: SBBP repeat-containing protein [Blastocatellia bacterium]|nr:SBBP repeat-containing protein [Blastocatellia bacterium]
MRARVLESYGKLPLSFEPNQGQTDRSVKFLSRTPRYQLFLTASEAILRLWKTERMDSHANNAADHLPKSSVLRIKLIGANGQPKVEGEEQLEGKRNYLIGNDRSKWQTDVPTFRRVRYADAWPGIDLVWYGNQGTLEYDFVVKSGADLSRIRLEFQGADRLHLDGEGNLVAKTRAGEVTQRAPVIYQEDGQGRNIIAGRYSLKAGSKVGFEVSDFDRRKPLVIDPQLVYSSYLGANSVDLASAVAADNAGNAYLTGLTFSASFPATTVVDPDLDPAFRMAFVTKMNASGTGVVYSTLIGGSDFNGTSGNGIAVTSDGKACITGSTDNVFNRSKFPVTPNAFQKNGFCLGFTCTFLPDRVGDAFVTELNAQGNGLIYSTFFGGSSVPVLGNHIADDEGQAIAVDSANRIYIAGSSRSNNLPMRNAFQSSKQSSADGADAFIAVFNPSASNGNDTLLYSSFLGGSGDDFGTGIAVDGSRNAYVVGSSASNDLATKAPPGQTRPPLQASFQGGSTDAFIAKVDTEASGASSLTYLTYFGGNAADRAEAVAVDSSQRAYITGATSSSPATFPLLNAFDNIQNNGEAFVAKVNADGTAIFYSSFLGGTNEPSPRGFESGTGIVIDTAGNAYVAGLTSAGATFPTSVVAPPFPANLQGTAFVAKIQASVSTTIVPKLLYSTTFGGSGAKAEGIALDPKGNVYLAGETGGNLPTTDRVFQETFQGGDVDGFVAKIGSTFNDTIGVYRPSATDFLLRNSNTAGNPDQTIDFGIAGDLPVAGDWDGDGDDEPGVFRPSAGQFLLRKVTVTIVRPCFTCPPVTLTTVTVFTVNFGQAGDLPVVGDWNGDGVDTVGVLRNGTFLLTNGLNVDGSTPPVDITAAFGQAGDLPVAGDWDGDGIDTIGFFRPTAIQVVLSNNNSAIDFSFFAGLANDLPVAGDWDGDGVDTIGLFDNGTVFLFNSNVNPAVEITFSFGAAGDQPLGGDWDGKPGL